MTTGMLGTMTVSPSGRSKSASKSVSSAGEEMNAGAGMRVGGILMMGWSDEGWAGQV